MWLLFRCTGDPESFYISPMVTFGFDRDDINTSIFVGNLNGFQLIGKVLTPMPIDQDIWYHIKVEVQGTKVAIWVDDVLMRTVDWSNQPQLPKSGSLLIGSGGAELHFDNFRITGTEINLGVSPKGKLAAVWGNPKK